MSNVTAKVIVNSVSEYKDAAGEVEQVTVGMNADYSDGRNKEWSKYTPGISVSITVKAELAYLFPKGQAFMLTFEPDLS